MRRKSFPRKNYRSFEVFQKHIVPGLPHVAWGWFKDTITARDICFFLGVKSKEDILHVWNTLFQSLPPEEDVMEGFEGLHVRIQDHEDPSSFEGSAIFIKSMIPSVLAHETYHAVCACSQFTSIHDEEFKAHAISSWMDIILSTLRQRIQKPA